MRRKIYTISTDKAMLDLNLIHTNLKDRYWPKDIPRDVLGRAVEHVCRKQPYPSGPWRTE